MNDKTHGPNSLTLATRLTEDVTATQEEDSRTRWHPMKAIVGRLYSGPGGREKEEEQPHTGRSLQELVALYAPDDPAHPGIQSDAQPSIAAEG
ncbi:MAG: hypothetical protein H6Q55_4105 [Deltaproteobacteria bacterium]|nr:hypothetical protein [Deltaproteobacteria bacterium]